ncbi:MAG: CBS domain-containing protein, partial [Myxococcales bacterium]|nr:CBS domain-containing protein [Myxococcales bacterium]
MHTPPSKARRALDAYPPFDRLPAGAREALAEACQLRAVTAGEPLFAEGEAPGPDFFVVLRGAVALTRRLDEGIALVDLCDEGTLFGVRAHLRGDVYSASAEARESGELLAVAYAAFAPLLEAHPQLSLYFAAGFAAELPRARDRLLAAADRALHRRGLAGGAFDDVDRVVSPSIEVVTAHADTSISEAARRMQARNVGSIVVVDATGRPRGIVTDADLRGRVLAAGVDPKSPLALVMSAPVITVTDEITAGELVMQMMRRRVHHFCVTADGTDASPVTGVISERDVLTTQGAQPTALLDQIALALDGERLGVLAARAEALLGRFLDQERPMGFIAGVMTALDDALVRQAVTLSLAAVEARGLGPPPAPFCWVALGSEGREERLLRTDRDNALIYADPPAGREEAVHQWFAAFGLTATRLLAEAGTPPRAGGVTAGHPRWVQPLTAWRGRLLNWVEAADVAALRPRDLFFDLRAVAGDPALAEAVLSHLVQALDAHPDFLPRLARAAL